ncbi:multiheme c-type cytochrome [Rubripirellula sp.]|nr:multiheme c-type cytochrome [Rubripirellula sp.]MDB4654342.1 multiheme c-type cytochrome [Rubripirellula sp.]
MKLASINPRYRNLQLVDLLGIGLRAPIIFTLLAIGIVGCSSEDRSAEVSSSVDRDGDLSNPPLDPPYLTDLKEGSDEGVAMRFGEPGQAKTEQDQGNAQDEDPGKTAASNQSDAQVVADDPATGSSAASTVVDENVGPNKGIIGPEDYKTWAAPDLTLVVTGQQHGYIEPCGCTGLDRQKGGVARRFTLMKQLRELGWTLMPLDAGNLVRRFGRQAEVKLQQSVKALKLMGYDAVGFGSDDLRLGVGELLAVAAAEDTPEDTLYASGNVVVIDPSLMLQSKVVEKGGLKIGVTSILDEKSMEVKPGGDLGIEPAVESTRKVLAELNQSKPDFRVLMFFGKEDAARDLARAVPGFDLIVVGGGGGEPTYQAEQIEGTETRMILTGNKAMYAGLVGLYAKGELKYARVPLTHEFEDAPEMRQLMKEYQEQLKDIGLEGLGLKPIRHSSGEQFVGSEACGKCHTTAYDIWQGTPHAEATEHIVKPPAERGDVARHFDPECISCHVTGWNAQEYYPYVSGYLSLDKSPHLTGNGCENCHGPGAGHAAAEAEGATVTDEVKMQLRDLMKLPLSKARDKCMTCHDLDNSPDFHEDGAFEDIYWPEVEHYGKD